MACKWMENRSMLLLSSALKGINDILSVQRKEKGLSTKSSVPSPKVSKFCNSGMGGADLMDQLTAAYHLARNPSVRLYLRIFFDLKDITCVNSYLIYNMKHPDKLFFLGYKIAGAKNLIQYHQGRNQYQSRDHLRGRTNLNRLIIIEDIYQVTRRCENDAHAV